jgi:hypothetical protein
MSDIRHVQVKLPADLADWFDEHCSVFSKQEFVEQCFIYLRIATEQGLIPVPGVYPAKAAMLAASHLTTREGTDGPSSIRSEP